MSAVFPLAPPRSRRPRTTFIGASEIAAVVGTHPTRGPIDVFVAKTEPDAVEEPTSTLPEFGQRIERVMGEAWQARHPQKDIFTPGTIFHANPDLHMCGASADRVVVPMKRRARELWEQALEIKVAFFHGDRFGAEGTDEVPEHYLTQVQYQLEVLDLPHATLVALVQGDYREYPIERDREFGALLVDAAAKFWTDHVAPRRAPPVDGTDAYAAYLKRRHPRDVAPPIAPTNEAVAAVNALRDAKALLAQAEDVEAAAANRLRALLGDAAGVEGLCSYRATKDRSHTKWEDVARDLFARLAGPMNQSLLDEVIQAHTTTSPGARVLRLSKTKE